MVATRARPLPEGEAPSPAKTRRANLGRGFHETPIFDGGSLSPGAVIEGPAIVEESFTTIVVYPGWRARVDEAGDLRLVRSRA